MPDTSTELFQSSVVSSLTGLRNKPTDLISEIQLTGFYQGRKAYYWNIMGNRSTFNNNSSQHDICEFLTTETSFTPVTTADSLEIISTSLADSMMGTGARKVRVTYLDVNGVLTESPEIILGGIISVAAGFNATGILWMEVTDGGTGETAAGNISLQRSGGGVIYERILAGGNKSLSGRIMVPKGFTGYLTDWSGSSNVQFTMLARATVGTFGCAIIPRFVFQARANVPSNQTFSSSLNMMKFPELARVKISGRPTNSTSAIDVSFGIIAIANQAG